MRIQFFSDLHLEFGPLDVPATDADLCVAAGDINVRDTAIEWLAQLRMPVVYVAGNHEFYTGETGAVRRRLRERAAAAGIHFLDDDEVVIDGVRFLGTTLWTDFGGADPGLMARAARGMNDYLQIHQGTGLLTPEQTLARHRASRAWLEGALARPHAGPTVVVSHHAPTERSWSGHYDPVYRPAYCNTLDDLLAAHDVAVWFHGHIHACSDYLVHGTRVVCNPRGYHGHQHVPGFDPGRCIDL